MPIITDESDARARLKFEIQFDTPPELTDTGDGNDIDMILDKWARGGIWATGTNYSVGDVVIPATRNGHRFVCVTSGTSGATEPVWPKSNYARVGDGDVLWEEAGSEYDLWDMDQAIHEGWKIKKAKAVIYINSAEPGLSDVYEHCAEMAERSKPAGLA